MELLLGAVLFFYGLFEWNMRVYKPFEAVPPEAGGTDAVRYPRVSILVPCRNEAKRVEPNLISMLSQDYSDYEVIALDDGSEDNTFEVLSGIKKRYPRLRVIRGADMPEGWQGKNHACRQLSLAAGGDWLLFADADTRCEPGMLRSAMRTVLGQSAQMLSTFPRQVFSKGDEWVVPLMFFILLSFLPMYFVAKRTWKWAGTFATACGQFLLMRRDAYDRAGGHLAVKGRISEGPLLAARIKNAGFKIVLRDGSKYISCRMYENFGQAFESFSRSVFASMGGSVITLGIFLFLQTALYVVPYAILAAGPWLDFTAADWLAVAVMILVPIWARCRIHLRTGMPLKTVPGHFISMILYQWIMLNSLIHYRVKKKTVWKNRTYASPQA